MASRPLFVPNDEQPGSVRTVPVTFVWHAGFAPIQKQRNIRAMHAGAAEVGFAPILEVSTKSSDPFGVEMSAFNLELVLPSGMQTSVEAAFQGSKVFERGGPYQDLYSQTPREAKKDERLRTNGAIVGFRLESIDVPTEPKTLFYDWLYARAVAARPDLANRLLDFRGFTDIEFNPARSVNCQARSCAVAAALHRRGALESGVGNFVKFAKETGMKLRTASSTRGEQGEWSFSA